MSKYTVILEAVASISVEVEADSEDEAIDLAFEHTPPKGRDWPDLGDWYFAPDEDAKRKRSDYLFPEEVEHE